MPHYPAEIIVHQPRCVTAQTSKVTWQCKLWAEKNVHRVSSVRKLKYSCRHVVSNVIARQHAVKAQRDIDIAIPSVCPSNAGIMSKPMHISSHFLTAW